MTSFLLLLLACVLDEMPNMNGPDACKIMREIGCDSFIVGVTGRYKAFYEKHTCLHHDLMHVCLLDFLIVSGNILPDDVAHFKHRGANCVLGKPLQVSDLETLWIEFGITR